MFRKPRFIVFTAVALYALAMLLAWNRMTRHAEQRIMTMLESAERGYADVIYGEIEAALRFVGGIIINTIDLNKPTYSIEEMSRLADNLKIDEITVVEMDGRVIGSNLPENIGFNFKSTPVCAEFLELTNATRTCVSQRFRKGVTNPGSIMKYYGLPFPGRKRLVQLGISLDHLRTNMYSFTPEESREVLLNWHFSVEGWYESATDDPDFADGKVFRRKSGTIGAPVVGRYFHFLPFKYAAFLPESYCYVQRNGSFAVTAIILAALFGIFTFGLVRLVCTSDKLEELHAKAEARTAEDLRLAHQIQLSALPSVADAYMNHLEFSLRAASTPARVVGGDFYDFVTLPDGRLAFVIADVSGKGIAGAMFMMEAKNVLGSCLTTCSDLEEAVTCANARLCENNRAELFVTAWIGILDLQTGQIDYVNAGHCRPFIRRESGTVEKVTGKGGLFLGMFENAAYRAHSIFLDKGDKLYLYTDGITEAMSEKGELFGERRLVEILSAEGPDGVPESVRNFVGNAEQSDDLTDMTIVWHGTPTTSASDFVCNADSLEDAVDFIRTAISDLPAKAQAAVLNAADEVTANIVNYSGSSGYRIVVERSPECLRLTFSDKGRPYNPLTHADPDTHASIEDRPIGGLGLVMVKRLVDRVTYSNENGCNVLRLLKRYGA